MPFVSLGLQDTGFVRHAVRRDRENEERLLLSGLSADETTDDEAFRRPVQMRPRPVKVTVTNGSASGTEGLEKRSYCEY